MDSAETALEAIRSMLNLPRLSFNDNGQAAILVENVVHIDISRQSETEIELLTPLRALEGELTPARVFALMKGNYLGHHTGAARLALDPRDGEPVLCQRIDVAPLDADALEAAMAGFVGFATYWLADGVSRILAIEDDGAAQGPASESLESSDEHLIMRL